MHDARLPKWWQRLFAEAANASAFLSPGWISTWLASYGSAFKGDWVSFWEGDHCVAGCLLLFRPAKVGPFPVRLAVINTAAEDAEESPWVEYNDVLCVAGFEDDVARALVDLLRERPWDQLYLSGYADGGVMSRLCQQYPNAAVDSVAKLSHFVDLGRMTGNAESLLSSNSRTQIKRSMRLYGQRGEVHVTAAGSLAEAHTFLTDLARLHRDGWKRRGKHGGFLTERFFDFHRCLIEAMWVESGIVLLRAAAGEHVIGYLYYFVHAGKIYFYQSGFVYEDDPKLKPGLVAHCMAINYFNARGLREYDFMAGDARYKASLANASRHLEWAWVERQTPRMRAVGFVRHLKRKLMSARQSDKGSTTETAPE